VSEDRPYHHGDLRREVLRAALEVIDESGTAGLSLRDLARRAGVSHAAPAHHFGDKAGLLTAIAAEGFDLLADALVDTRHKGGDFYDVGATYVQFAVHHPAHFEVMFRPDLYHSTDAALAAASDRAARELHEGMATLAAAADFDPERGAIAAWAFVHGFATLWLTGVLPSWLGNDPRAATQDVARTLFGNP
jgi:AcrR family transcriptional regulator